MKIFLKVDKDLFNKGLNPVEILVLSQVIEFNTNTGDCFISDKQLAEQFGVSDKTISRAIKHLEELGYIKRETKNVRGGKERHIKLADFTKDNLSIDKGQNDCCTKDKLSLDKGQIDLIKDNIKDNIKENKEKEEPSALIAPQSLPAEEKLVKVERSRIYQLWHKDRVNWLNDNTIQVDNKTFRVVEG